MNIMLISMRLYNSCYSTFTKTILIAVFCVAAIPNCITQDTPESTYTEISKVLFEQQKYWNEGDIDKFMLGYWQSEELIFIASNGVTKGWNNILTNYKKAYPNKLAMGQLEFTILEIKLLESDHALLLGQYKLTREHDMPVGYFSLVLEKIDGLWRIIIDHTSS